MSRDLKQRREGVKWPLEEDLLGKNAASAKPRRGDRPGMFKEEQEGQCGPRRVSKGK